jgi:hypothetical protein
MPISQCNRPQSRVSSWTYLLCLALATATTGITGSATAEPSADSTETPIDLSTRRELFVDRLLIDRLEGAELRLVAPRDEGVVLPFDQPWEGLFCGYATLLFDGNKYRLTYRGRPQAGSDGDTGEVTCYAESSDGIRWTKPKLGLFEVAGTRENNIILADAAPVTHNFCPMLDRRPGLPEDQRFKAVGGISSSGLFAYASADCIHWRKMQEAPIFKPTGWVLDSQNLAFWSAAENKYLLYYRSSVDGVRAIARATSDDFLHWSEPEQMTFSDTDTTRPSQHLYTSQTHPYFRAPHLYLSTAARFMPGRQVLSPAEAEAIGVHPKYFGDTSDCVLMSSRGGARYDRCFLEGLIKPGLGTENWVSRTNYPALGIVPTGAAEMSLYVNQNYGQPTAHLHRYSWRTDGLVQVWAPAAGGELRTVPVTFDGNRLEINFSTSAAGSIRVELQDESGQPIPGWSLEEGRELIGNSIDRIVSWKGGPDVGSLAGRAVRLRFVMRDALLYSFRFKGADETAGP